MLAEFHSGRVSHRIARTDPTVGVTDNTDQYNVRGGKVELHGSPVTLLML